MHRGLLNKQVMIQQRTTDTNSSGQQKDSWVNVAFVYAYVKPIVGKDYLAASQLQTELTHDITIAYRRGITSGMRVLYSGRYFEIVSPPLDPEEKRNWLYLKCKEVVSN